MSKLLDFVKFNDLSNWSVIHLLQNSFNYNKDFPLVKIGTFLTRNKTQVIVDNDTYYKRVTIKLYNGGVLLRDTEQGKNIGTKKQFLIKKGQFLLSKIDARNGAFGVVSEEVDEAIITGNFWTFDVDYSQINPYYLALITTTKEFMTFAQSASKGTTGRHYLDELRFLDTKIPLPKLDIQEQIVKSYQNKINLAHEQEKKAKDLETEIEDYLYKELGLLKPIINKEKKEKLLEFLEYKDLNTWSYEQLKFNSGFKSIFNTKNFEEACILKNKSFNKKNYNDDKFNYVDIGSVDPILGILESKTISLSKAPSRATQYINTGDLIIATTRPYLKKFAIVEEKFNENVCSSGFTVIEYNPTRYNLEFIKEFLQSYYGIEQFKEKMTGGLYPAITLKELKTIKIPFPDVKIQDIIAKNINEMKNQIKLLNQQSLDNKKLALEEFEKEVFSV